MTYKMKTKGSGGARGPRGLAKVQISKKGDKVKVTYKDDPKNPYVLYKDDCPNTVQDGYWMVSLNAEGTQMFGIYPEKGNMTVRVKEFIATGDDGVPEPRTKDVSFQRDGKDHSYSYEYFLVNVEIVEPERYKGMEFVLMLRYHFDSIMEDGKEVAVYSKPSSKYTSDLIDFFKATHVLEHGPIPWSDNILPDVERRIVHTDRQFAVTLKNGWLVNGSIMDLAEPETTDVPWEEDETPIPETKEPTQTPLPDFDDDEFGSDQVDADDFE